jgi:hypothetical protein
VRYFGVDASRKVVVVAINLSVAARLVPPAHADQVEEDQGLRRLLFGLYSNRRSRSGPISIGKVLEVGHQRLDMLN